jgi:hypothetical protein
MQLGSARARGGIATGKSDGQRHAAAAYRLDHQPLTGANPSIR